MLEGRFAAEALQPLERLKPDVLGDVLDLALAPRIAPRGGKNARGILLDQRLKAGGIAFQHCRYQLRIGPFHPVHYANPLP